MHAAPSKRHKPRGGCAALLTLRRQHTRSSCVILGGRICRAARCIHGSPHGRGGAKFFLLHILGLHDLHTQVTQGGREARRPSVIVTRWASLQGSRVHVLKGTCRKEQHAFVRQQRNNKTGP